MTLGEVTAFSVGSVRDQRFFFSAVGKERERNISSSRKKIRLVEITGDAGLRHFPCLHQETN